MTLIKSFYWPKDIVVTIHQGPHTAGPKTNHKDDSFYTSFVSIKLNINVRKEPQKAVCSCGFISESVMDDDNYICPACKLWKNFL